MLEAVTEGARRYGTLKNTDMSGDDEIGNVRPFDGKKLAEPRPCPECRKDVVLVDTTTGLCKNCFDMDQSK